MAEKNFDELQKILNQYNSNLDKINAFMQSVGDYVMANTQLLNGIMKFIDFPETQKPEEIPNPSIDNPVVIEKKKKPKKPQ